MTVPEDRPFVGEPRDGWWESPRGSSVAHPSQLPADGESGAVGHTPCPSCGLTPVGNRVLRSELDRLQRRSPPGAWTAEVCVECSGVCLVVDDEDGWSLGSPPVGPVRVVGPGLSAGRSPTGRERRGSALPELAAGATDVGDAPDPRAVVDEIVAKVAGRAPVAGVPEAPSEAPREAPPEPREPHAPPVREPAVVLPQADDRVILPEAWAFASGVRRASRKDGRRPRPGAHEPRTS